MGVINETVVVANGKGYFVKDNGSVVSPYGNVLKLARNKNFKHSRLSFTIKNLEGERKTVPVHKLAAYQKYGKAVFKKGVQVRHLNSNGLDNSLANIAIGSASDNMQDIPQEKRQQAAICASSKIRKFSDEVVAEIKAKREAGYSYSVLMKQYSITSKGTLSYMINNKYKTKK